MQEKDQNTNQAEAPMMREPMTPQPMPGPMQGPMVAAPRPRGWRAKMTQAFSDNMMPNATLYPKWLSQYAVWTYVLALAVVSIIYSAHALPWYYMLSGVVSVLVFFLYGRKVYLATSINKIKKPVNFEKRIFVIAFIPRLLFMLLLYWIFMENYGDAFGFESGDATYYNDLGQYVATLISDGNFHFYDEISHWCGNPDIADMGYGVYVGFVYWLTGNSIIAVRLLKCVWSSLTVVLLYRLAKREFGEPCGRIAAVFCALMPNFWYYCATHLKETEMVFLVVLYIDLADQMLRSRQFTVWKIAPVLIIAATLFTFRTPLGLVAILALIFSLVMSSSKVIGWGKRIIVGVLTILLIGATIGNRIQEKARSLTEQVSQADYQKNNMEWRSKRDHGNTFAKYAGAAVFAPMIFTLPFPTMAHASENQSMQELFNGGNFIKNVLSVFTIFALILLLLSGKWREHTLSLSLILGYLVILVMSSFPHSERFHQPVLALELMYSTYGISFFVGRKKYRRWFLYWCILMFVVAIAWNWFKLAGRGLI